MIGAGGAGRLFVCRARAHACPQTRQRQNSRTRRASPPRKPGARHPLSGPRRTGAPPSPNARKKNARSRTRAAAPPARPPYTARRSVVSSSLSHASSTLSSVMGGGGVEASMFGFFGGGARAVGGAFFFFFFFRQSAATPASALALPLSIPTLFCLSRARAAPCRPARTGWTDGPPPRHRLLQPALPGYRAGVGWAVSPGRPTGRAKVLHSAAKECALAPFCRALRRPPPPAHGH